MAQIIQTLLLIFNELVILFNIIQEIRDLLSLVATGGAYVEDYLGDFNTDSELLFSPDTYLGFRLELLNIPAYAGSYATIGASAVISDYGNWYVGTFNGYREVGRIFTSQNVFFCSEQGVNPFSVVVVTRYPTIEFKLYGLRNA